MVSLAHPSGLTAPDFHGVRWADGLEGKDPRHQRQAADTHHSGGQHLHDTHGCFSLEPDQSGWELYGNSCACAQYYFKPSQLQHLQLCCHVASRRGVKATGRSPLAEHSREDRVDVLEVVTEVELVLDLGRRKRGGYFGIGLEQVEQR